ncbi:MAG: TrbC/VirB2 family protein [Rickettsiaceae bacterium]|nr:TrbC/VirB2 family protein [Rickettsiaceae bacterium]
MKKNFVLDRDLYWRMCSILTIIALSFVMADNAFANFATYDKNDVIGGTLCKVTTLLTGNTARAVSSIAIFTTGISLFMGKMQWTTAAMIGVGIGLIFSSASIITFISGSGGACVTGT